MNVLMKQEYEKGAKSWEADEPLLVVENQGPLPIEKKEPIIMKIYENGKTIPITQDGFIDEISKSNDGENSEDSSSNNKKTSCQIGDIITLF